jgi:hypothetical protein
MAGQEYNFTVPLKRVGDWVKFCPLATVELGAQTPQFVQLVED